MSRFIIPGQNYSNLKIENLNKTGGTSKPQTSEKPGISFEELLKEKKGEVKFSSHAQKRIEERKLDIDTNEVEKLQKGIDKLKEKGGRESVILLNDKAYVVSVKNNTVVTIMDDSSMKENVFTNIDSMVIL